MKLSPSLQRSLPPQRIIVSPIFLKVYGPLEQYIVFPFLIEIQIQETFTCILIWKCWLRFGLTVWETLWSRKDFGELKNKHFWGAVVIGSQLWKQCRVQRPLLSDLLIFQEKLRDLDFYAKTAESYKLEVLQVVQFLQTTCKPSKIHMREPELALVSQVFGLCSWLPLGRKRNNHCLESTSDMVTGWGCGQRKMCGPLVILRSGQRKPLNLRVLSHQPKDTL